METQPKTTWGIKLNLLQHCKLLFDSVVKCKQEIWEVQTEIRQSERPNCTTTRCSFNLFLTPFSTSVRLCWCCESYKGNYQTPDAHIFHRAASCPLCFWSHLSVISLPLSLCLWCAWVGAASPRFLSLLIDVVRQLPSITARVSVCLPASLSQVAVASDTDRFYLVGAPIDFSSRHAKRNVAQVIWGGDRGFQDSSRSKGQFQRVCFFNSLI